MPSNFVNSTSYARNLEKSQLGGVIFGCKKNTMSECLSEQIFGLPAPHFSYVKNIDPGLPLFLFNYENKKLYGIFEAAGAGQMNINPYGWTTDGSRRTQYPAQVQIRVRLQCHPLSEEKFKPIIADNYYRYHHFWFELDHAQTSKLMSLFASSPVAPGTSAPENTAKWRTIYQPISLSERRDEGYKPLASEVENHTSCSLNFMNDASSLDGKDKLLENQLNTNIVEQVEKDLTLQQLQGLAPNHEHKGSSLRDCVQGSTAINDMGVEENGSAEEQMGLGEKNEKPYCASFDCQSIIAQVLEDCCSFFFLLVAYQVEAEEQIQQLKNRCMMLESMSNLSFTEISDTASDSFEKLNLDPTKSIYLVGGYDGESWLSALDLYFPLQDVSKSLRPMSTIRSYTSLTQFNDEIYVIGGGIGDSWYATVESYNPANDQWALRPALTRKKGSLGGATLNDKIFVIGGGNGLECFSDVEMLDLDVGRWIPTRSMLQKRFALAAVELNGVLYATGGYDGSNYLRSAERFDPREHCWSRIPNMNTKRGCHSLVVLNEKLYALGGFDGNTMVSSTEIFDPRLSMWMDGEAMNTSRGYSAAAVVDESIYVIGGVKDGEIIVDTVCANRIFFVVLLWVASIFAADISPACQVEHFKMGEGWQESRTTRKRCFLSTIVLQ
ncbi:conserved hypothetical protein [Ricinus communis]|uniref:DCD domain-containing protein n=1 Tax=Ricinus communis TaxID=3988 RepID=B9SL20_RICCO|nr:conserved hypothetical protein [Ricinus communis]